MSHRLRCFLPLRCDKNGQTFHAAVVAYELAPRPVVPDHPRLTFDSAATLTAITRGQRIPMKADKAQRLLRRLVG